MLVSDRTRYFRGMNVMEIGIFRKTEFNIESGDIITDIMTEEGLSQALSDSSDYTDHVLTILQHAFRINEFRGRLGDFLIVYPNSVNDYTHMFLGLGSRSELSSRRFQDAGGLLAKRLANLDLASTILDLSTTENIDPYETIKPFVEGIAIGAYSFSKYYSKRKQFPLGSMRIVIADSFDQILTESAIQDASYNVKASNTARLLTDEASNHKTPARFEQLIRDILTHHNYNIRVLNQEELIKEKLLLLNAVGKAGSDPPRLMIIERRIPENQFTLGMVGKAVTFDSGGLMIKSHDQMPYMREDVGGAAALIGALSVMNELDLNYNVVAAIPIAENLIDSNSYRPSDVLVTRSGISVEINNTDAEGRLLLADSFTYLQDQYQLNALLDVATLTGAISRALGNKIAGYFTNHPGLDDLFMAANYLSREKFWKMPLEMSYNSCLKSKFADIRNDGGEPKAITAALFLNHFIEKSLPWIHLDVGSIVTPSIDDPLYGGTNFATGIPSLTLIELLRMLKHNIHLFNYR